MPASRQSARKVSVDVGGEGAHEAKRGARRRPRSEEARQPLGLGDAEARTQLGRARAAESPSPAAGAAGRGDRIARVHARASR